MKHKIIIIYLLFLLSGCKRLVEIPPPDTEIIRTSVFDADRTALAALSGVYRKLVQSPVFDGGTLSTTMAQGVYADELTCYAMPGHPIIPYYFNTVVAATPTVSSVWASCYNMIYSANAVIEGIQMSKGVSETTGRQLIGEALFLRAFIHFYLVNVFGAVPYIATTDYIANSKVVRTPVNEVYERLIADLIEARNLLSIDYPAVNRVRINKDVATALLARVYLYKGDWENAELGATSIINNSRYKLLPDLNKVFLKESEETIWQLIPLDGYTTEGLNFILVAPPNLVALNNSVISSFEPGDLRKRDWTDSLVSTSGISKWYFPYKYKVKNIDNGEEYSIVLRLAEQYLIRSEARAKQNRLTGANSAAADLDTLRKRAGLSGAVINNEVQYMTVLEHERKVELFTEYGHRFFDLKRWNRLDAVLTPIKPNWKTSKALLPIPQSEIIINPALKQNKDY